MTFTMNLAQGNQSVTLSCPGIFIALDANTG